MEKRAEEWAKKNKPKRKEMAPMPKANVKKRRR